MGKFSNGESAGGSSQNSGCFERGGSVSNPPVVPISPPHPPALRLNWLPVANDREVTMLETYFGSPKMVAHLRAGPSGPYLDGPDDTACAEDGEPAAGLISLSMLRRAHDRHRDVRAWLHTAASPNAAHPDRQFMTTARHTPRSRFADIGRLLAGWTAPCSVHDHRFRTVAHAPRPLSGSNRFAAPVLPSRPCQFSLRPTSNSQPPISLDDQITIGRPWHHREPPRGFLLPALSDALDACRPSLSLGPCRQASEASDNP